MFDYETLKLIWWGLIGVLLIGFALTDGFDLGSAILLPLVARSDGERRVVINSVAPHWDGNQVWLITAGGALFAAWPMVYAAAFSGFYWAMLLVLFALFFRPVGFDYRSKIEDPRWRASWDWALFVGGLVPALVFGIAFGNLLQGVPFTLDEFLRPSYQGSFWALLNPLGLLAGLVSLSMITLQGAAWQMLRSSDAVRERARRAAAWCALLFLIGFAVAGVWVSFGLQGYSLAGELAYGEQLNPLDKQVLQDNHGWLANYRLYPAMMTAPLLGLVGGLLALLGARRGSGAQTFLGSSLAIVGTILTAGFAMFPFVMPSSLAPAASLTLWDAASSPLTLGIMTGVAALMVPIVLAYTLWSYAKLWRRLNTAQIAADSHELY